VLAENVLVGKRWGRSTDGRLLWEISEKVPPYREIKIDRSGLAWALRGCDLVAFDANTGKIERHVKLRDGAKGESAFAFAGGGRIYVLRDVGDGTALAGTPPREAATELIVVE
jgi:hypothetical protein